MKVLHVTNYDRLGGAGIAASRLHQALRLAGVDSRMLVRTKGSDDPTVEEVGSFGRKGVGEYRGWFPKAQSLWSKAFSNRLAVRARGWLGAKLTKTLGMEDCSLNIFPTGLHRVLNASGADVIHLHWINNEMISIKEIAKITKPLVWTLHDCWPLLGAEHHSSAERNDAGVEEVRACGSKGVGGGQRSEGLSRMGVKEFGSAPSTQNPAIGTCVESRSLDGECTSHIPHPTTHRAFCDVNKWIFKKKQKAWRNLKVSFIAPSHWMAEQVRQSRLFADAPVEVIPNGLDLQVFKPMDKGACRRKWNLPLDKKLILFGAYNPLDSNKGCDLLEQALRKLSSEVRDSVGVVVFGCEGNLGIGGLPTHWMGRIGTEKELAKLYNAADIVCVPSRRESFGQTASEALACGVPVVAFRTTGLIDIVDHQKNGYLAEPFDTGDFCRGIEWILGEGERLGVSEYGGKGCGQRTCRHKAESICSFESSTQKHKLIYRNLISIV